MVLQAGQRTSAPWRGQRNIIIRIFRTDRFRIELDTFKLVLSLGRLFFFYLKSTGFNGWVILHYFTKFFTNCSLYIEIYKVIQEWAGWFTKSYILTIDFVAVFNSNVGRWAWVCGIISHCPGQNIQQRTRRFIADCIIEILHRSMVSALRDLTVSVVRRQKCMQHYNYIKGKIIIQTVGFPLDRGFFPYSYVLRTIGLFIFFRRVIKFW